MATTLSSEAPVALRDWAQDADDLLSELRSAWVAADSPAGLTGKVQAGAPQLEMPAAPRELPISREMRDAYLAQTADIDAMLRNLCRETAHPREPERDSTMGALLGELVQELTRVTEILAQVVDCWRKAPTR